MKIGVDLVDVELVPDDQVKGRTGHAGKGDFYGKYKRAVEDKVPWILEQLTKSKNGIRVKAADFAKALGGEFVNKSPTSVQWALKFVLFEKGIIVGTGTHVDGSELLTFRLKSEKEQLPDSLKKKLNKSENAEAVKAESETESSEEKDE